MSIIRVDLLLLNKDNQSGDTAMNARPAKDEQDKQKKQMAFWCTEDEQNDIERMAKAQGYSKKSDYMRRVCLGYETADRSCLEEK